jgi:hypothetical protein
VGFTIDLGAPSREYPDRENRELAVDLMRAFPTISDFPLDHDLIAREYANVPRDEVLNHWAQLELHADERLGNAIITIWLSAAFVELPSTPAESCEARLRRVEPILRFFRERGFSVPRVSELVTDYEQQGKRVETVTHRIDGRTPIG